jgi:hypothetical protein
LLQLLSLTSLLLIPLLNLDILLNHGIIKERISALLTDSIRANVLEDMGYTVDMIEFIDFDHSPKNIMIRAKRNGKPGTKGRKQAQELANLETIKEAGSPVKAKIANTSGANNRTAGAAILSGSVIISQLTLNGPLGTADYTSQFQGYGQYTVGA